VVGRHIDGDFAAVYILTDEGADWLSLVRRDEGGWTEVAGGDGGPVWVDTDDDADQEVNRGVLAYATLVAAPGAVRGPRATAPYPPVAGSEISTTRSGSPCTPKK
jgi:hypothetical protein